MPNNQMDNERVDWLFAIVLGFGCVIALLLILLLFTWLCILWGK